MKTEYEGKSDLAVLAQALKFVLDVDLDASDAKDLEELRAKARELSEQPDSLETEAILEFLASRQSVKEVMQPLTRATCTLKRSARQVPEHLNFMNRGKPYPPSSQNEIGFKP